MHSNWWVMESRTTIDLWLPSFFMKVAHCVLEAGDGIGLTVASKNKLLEAHDHKEAIQNSIEPGYNNNISVIIRSTKRTGAAKCPHLQL